MPVHVCRCWATVPASSRPPSSQGKGEGEKVAQHRNSFLCNNYDLPLVSLCFAIYSLTVCQIRKGGKTVPPNITYISKPNWKKNNFVNNDRDRDASRSPVIRVCPPQLINIGSRAGISSIILCWLYFGLWLVRYKDIYLYWPLLWLWLVRYKDIYIGLYKYGKLASNGAKEYHSKVPTIQ